MEISPSPQKKIVPPPLVVSQNALGMMGEPSSHAPVVHHWYPLPEVLYYPYVTTTIPNALTTNLFPQ